MQTFAKLLSQYMRRTGISDTELARYIGVRRQTVFRWREGLTTRVRHRDDVLRCAEKLRLTDSEQDEFLMAAGFAPMEIAVGEDSAGQASGNSEDETIAATSQKPRARRPWYFALAVLIVVGVVAGWMLIVTYREHRQAAAIVPAAPGEVLIFISQFTNYSGQVGYNVAGRIRESLEQEFEKGNIALHRVEILDSPLADRDEALSVGQMYGATLVIWGEYDSGRVTASFILPIEASVESPQRLVRQVATPDELNAIINTELPAAARWIALVSLGQVHYAAQKYESALTAFERALDYEPQEQDELATVYFALGYIYHQQGDLSQAETFYSRAIEADAGLASAYNNRGVIYLERGSMDNLERAIDDFSAAIESVSNFGAPVFNRGLAHFRMGPAHDQAALEDLLRGQELEPNAAGPNNTLCWVLGILGRPSDALPYCDAAVAVDTTGLSRDSRGVANALLGRTEEAIEDFEVFLSWLETQPEDAQNQYAESRRMWIDVLRRGQNPFSEEYLQSLRNQ